ncbi:hypothetical protein KAM471c_37910 [Aeromonas caviae]|nr:hypothetical protein KAM329_040950 [Aeromonas caviae]BCR30877.1 hypothetical protein KAM376_38830 [Aeromonas caviae]BDA20012.1 hypothetical protein KAM345_039260 [Aeromonas caviae]BDN89976.1 hypothetical protein KAM471c_37910 [Aeromonas caviae]GJC00205.1 hypothetical protein KAM384_14860 [Aeromonas caviae]
MQGVPHGALPRSSTGEISVTREKGAKAPFLLAGGRGAPVWRPARDEREKRGTRPADSVCQHQEGEGEQETQQNEEEGTYPPDGGKNAENFVFACLWFHKIQITAWLHRINKIRPGA